jgi:hypothetical protein
MGDRSPVTVGGLKERVRDRILAEALPLEAIEQIERYASQGRDTQQSLVGANGIRPDISIPTRSPHLHPIAPSTTPIASNPDRSIAIHLPTGGFSGGRMPFAPTRGLPFGGILWV